MADILERTGSVLGGHLAGGETLLAATQAQLDGGTMRLASRVGTGAAGGALGVALTASAGDATDLEAKLTNGLVLAVTDHRVVLLDVTAVSARPKGPVLWIERARITDVTTGEKRVMLVKLPTIALTLDADDDNIVRFEIPKTARRDADAVVTALAS